MIDDNGLRPVDARRRWLAAGAAWPALAWTGTLHAQADARIAPVLIGWLSANRRDGDANAFHEGMATLGWKIRTQYRLEERHADGLLDRLPELAQELAAMKPAVIVARPASAARAAAAAMPTTPIVLANGDASSTGLVTNLARPGGMVTGLTNATGELNQKVVELLVESLPKLQRVGLLADSTSSSYSAIVGNARRAVERLRVEAVVADTARPEDIEPAVVQLAKAKVQALVILSSSWLFPHYPKVVELALAQRWPVVGTNATTPRLGGLFSYGPDRTALVRRSATYVDRILKGAKPGELPIELPTVFEMVLNMKTAKALGIVVPSSVRVRATEVIE